MKVGIKIHGIHSLYENRGFFYDSLILPPKSAHTKYAYERMTRLRDSTYYGILKVAVF
jgi:hypothetical protein